MFQRGQVFVSRIKESTSAGAAAMMVLLITVNVPPEPWVGTAIGGTRDDVTGEMADA